MHATIIWMLYQAMLAYAVWLILSGCSEMIKGEQNIAIARFDPHMQDIAANIYYIKS